jgi:hypothetical protein
MFLVIETIVDDRTTDDFDLELNGIRLTQASQRQVITS